jgi:hypothetical protein
MPRTCKECGLGGCKKYPAPPPPSGHAPLKIPTPVELVRQNEERDRPQIEEAVKALVSQLTSGFEFGDQYTTLAMPQAYKDLSPAGKVRLRSMFKDAGWDLVYIDDQRDGASLSVRPINLRPPEVRLSVPRTPIGEPPVQEATDRGV